MKGSLTATNSTSSLSRATLATKRPKRPKPLIPIRSFSFGEAGGVFVPAHEEGTRLSFQSTITITIPRSYVIVIRKMVKVQSNGLLKLPGIRINSTRNPESGMYNFSFRPINNNKPEVNLRPQHIDSVEQYLFPSFVTWLIHLVAKNEHTTAHYPQFTALLCVPEFKDHKLQIGFASVRSDGIVKQLRIFCIHRLLWPAKSTMDALRFCTTRPED